MPTQKALFAVNAPRNPRPLDIPIEGGDGGASSGKAASSGNGSASAGDSAQDGDIYDDFKFSSLMDDSEDDVDFSDVQPEETEPVTEEDPGNPFTDNGVKEE